MAYPETQTGKERQLAHLPPLRAKTGRTGRQSRTILEEHLDRLLAQLTRPAAAIDIGRVRKTLLDMSADIMAKTSVFQSNDYRWILDRLTDIYAQGFSRPLQEPFTITAAAYAQVIETLSHACPGHDYSVAVGQLLGYMSRLFLSQERSWKAVYEHILSIPDTVEAKQLLYRAFFVEIQEWAEAGVENLFSIRRDLYEKIGKLSEGIEGLNRQIGTIADHSRQGVQTATPVISPNVIDLAHARRKRLVAQLEHRQQRLIEEKEAKESILGFIESDIREFEEKLKNTKRAYFLRPV